MEVKITASGTDKAKRQKNAIEMAKLGPPFINPLDFFKDMDMNDPEGRAERGMMMSMDPAGYFMQFIKKMEVPQMAQALGGMPPPGGAPMPGQSPQGSSPVNPAQVPIEPP